MLDPLNEAVNPSKGRFELANRKFLFASGEASDEGPSRLFERDGSGSVCGSVEVI